MSPRSIWNLSLEKPIVLWHLVHVFSCVLFLSCTSKEPSGKLPLTPSEGAGSLFSASDEEQLEHILNSEDLVHCYLAPIPDGGLMIKRTSFDSLTVPRDIYDISICAPSPDLIQYNGTEFDEEDVESMIRSINSELQRSSKDWSQDSLTTINIVLNSDQWKTELDKLKDFLSSLLLIERETRSKKSSLAIILSINGECPTIQLPVREGQGFDI